MITSLKYQRPRSCVIYLFAAGLYFYHLGAWTYRIEGFTISEISAYPEVAQITYAYLAIIFIFLVSSVFTVIGGTCLLSITLGLLVFPVAYEVYRIIGVLSVYGLADPELLKAHLGLRLLLGFVAVFCLFQGTQLRKSFAKAK